MDQPSPLDRIIDAISRALMVIAGASLVILIAIMGWMVFGRYILNSTPTWVEPAAVLLIVVITFFGAAVGIRENSHLSVEIFRNMLPEGGRYLLSTISDLILAAFGGLMALHGYELSKFNLDTEIPLLHISEAWKSAPLAIGGSLIVLFSVVHIFQRFQRIRAHHRPAVAENVNPE